MSIPREVSGTCPASCGCREATAPAAPGAAGWLRRGGWLLLVLPLWFALYRALEPLAGWVTVRILGLDPASRLGSALPGGLMLIEVFGSGCAKCETLVKHAKQAAEQIGGDHRVVKVTDYAAMAARGILSTPALAVDGQLKFQGKVASPGEILEALRG